MEVGIFDLEVREKRNQAFLNKAKTGAKGGSQSRKGVRTPYDSMSRKEKRLLNGEVKTIMYETIVPVTEFEVKDIEMQKLMLKRWREIYPNENIVEQMKISRKRYDDLVKKLNLPRKPKTVIDGRKGKTRTVAIIEQVETQQTPKESVTEEIQQKLILSGLHLEYNGEYTADQLSKIFTKLQLLVDSEENKFNLSISLSERT
jgi:hypothetical protein